MPISSMGLISLLLKTTTTTTTTTTMMMMMMMKTSECATIVMSGLIKIEMHASSSSDGSVWAKMPGLSLVPTLRPDKDDDVNDDDDDDDDDDADEAGSSYCLPLCDLNSCRVKDEKESDIVSIKKMVTELIFIFSTDQDKFEISIILMLCYLMSAETMLNI